MQPIASTTELKDAIRQLEEKQIEQGQLLKEQFSVTFESIKPANLLKSFGMDIVSNGFINTILNTTLGLATGYFSRKLVIGSSGNRLKILIGNFLQLGMTGILTNPSVIKSIGQNILHGIFRKKNSIF